MATEVPPRAPDVATARGWKPYRLTVPQYLMMIDAGVFPPNARAELLRGRLVKMMVKGDPHDYAAGLICDEIRRLVPEGWVVREEKSLQLDQWSRPEPDGAIVRGPKSQYRNRTPHAGETALVVEVANSSYAYDRGEKWRSYAAAGIPIYWIVNLAECRIEVYTDPTGQGQAASYKAVAIHDAQASVPPIIEGREVGRIVVGDILP